MIYEILTIIFTLIWIFVLFKIGQKQEPYIFYLVLYSTFIIPIILTIILTPLILAYLTASLSSWLIIFFLIFVLERIAWGVSLNEVAGNEQIGWFYLIYSIPLMWLIYRVSLLKVK